MRSPAAASLPPITIGVTAALDGLRRYAGTALLLASAFLVGICVVLPLGSLFGRPGDWLGFRLLVHPIPGGDLGLPWLMDVAGPSAAQQEAVTTLGTLLLVTLAGTVLVGIVTILALGAARA